MNDFTQGLQFEKVKRGITLETTARIKMSANFDS